MRVLYSFPSPSATTNPYTTQLLRAVEPLAHCQTFSWRAALFSEYDIFHVHWPEVLTRGRSPVRRAGRQVLFALLIGRLRARRRTAVVRTIHNLQPHEGLSRRQQRLLAAFDRRTDYWIVLNARTPSPDPGRTEIIPHGHYIDWYRGHDVPGAVPGRILVFGFLRPYKGIEDLLAAVSQVDRPDIRLIVQGRPLTPEYGARLVELARSDDRVELRLEYATEPELAREIGEASLVALPYKGMLNSGAALLGLSLARPVLVPRTPANDDLAAEVGQAWVQRFDPPLTPALLEHALSSAEVLLRDSASGGDAAPDLSERGWERLGGAHVDAYTAALAAKRLP